MIIPMTQKDKKMFGPHTERYYRQIGEARIEYFIDKRELEGYKELIHKAKQKELESYVEAN